jgi:hypothetical protein
VTGGSTYHKLGDFSVRRILLLTALLLTTVFQNAWAFLGNGEVTISWDEDVTLRSGQLLPVKRTATIGPDGGGRAGKGNLKRTTIAFTYNGKRIEWTNENTWPIWYMPDILEIVNGEPVIFMPVHRWVPCYKHGFPQEGLIAFRLQDKQWLRTPVGEFPQDLEVNLLRSTHAIQYWSEYKDRRIGAKEKIQLERDSSWGPKQGTPISEVVQFYSTIEESCARMRPPPNPQLDETRQRNTDAETNAATIHADVVSVGTESELVSKEMFVEQRGQWTGVGYLNVSCKGIVERIEPVRQWSGDENEYGSRLVGYQLILLKAPIDKKRVPIHEASRAQMQCVVCDHTTIFVVRRKDKDNLIVHRFSHSGELQDAVRIFLPDTAKVVPGSDWGTLWTVIPGAKGNLAMLVVDYSYPQVENLGGTIRRKVSYAVRLPVR